MEDRSRHIFLLLLLGVLAGVPLVHTGYATPRDAYLALERVLSDASDPLLTGLHGPLEGIAAHLLPFVPGLGRHWLAESLSLASLACSIGAFAFAVRRLAGGSAAILATALLLLALQNSAPFNLISTDQFVVPLGIAFLWLAIERWWRYLDDPSRSWVSSATLFAAATFLHLALAACVVLFPALTLMRPREGGWRGRLRRALYAPHVLVALLAAMTSFTLKALLSAPPDLVLQDGVATGAASGLAMAGRSWMASLPLSGFAAAGDIVRDQFLGFGSASGRGDALRSVGDVAWVVKGLLGAALIVELARTSIPSERRRLLAWSGMLLMIASCLPLVLTGQTRFGAPPGAELTGYLGLSGATLMVAALLPALVARVPVRFHRAALIILGAGVCGMSYATDLANAHVASAQHRAYDRQRAIDQWFHSEAVQRLPIDAVMVAPSLFEGPSGEPLAAGYWTRYMEERLGRRVRVFRDEEAWRDALAASPENGVFVVTLAQEARDRTLMLVTAPSSVTADGALVSSEATLLTHGLARDVRIAGRLRDVECRGRIIVDGVQDAMTFGDRFVVRTRKPRQHGQWFWTHLSSDGARFEPQSIVVSHHLGGPEDGDGGLALSFDDGFAEPEAGLRWAAERATMTVENRTDRPVPASIAFRIATPGAPQSAVEISGGVTPTQWTVGGSPEPRLLRLQLPPRSRTPVIFATGAAAVTAPTDVNRRVLLFEELHARDESCKAAGA